MKAKKVFLVAFVFVLISGAIPVNAAMTPPEVVNLPYATKIIDGDMYDFLNLSTALVGEAEIPLISYVLNTTSSYLIWAHLATSAVPGNYDPENGWKWDTEYVIIPNPGSLSNVATEIYGPDTFGLAWAYDAANGTIHGLKREQRHNMTRVGIYGETLIDISKFGDAVIGAPSIALVGSHYRMAVVIRDDLGDFTYYKLVYMHYVGGSNETCHSYASGYQCDEIEISSQIPMSSPSLAYAGGDTGIAYVMGNAVRYAYPQISSPFHASNCGPLDGEFSTWRCLNIDAPVGGVTVGNRVALAYGSDGDHALITYSIQADGQDVLMRAGYVFSGGNCGRDVLSVGAPYGWDCQGVDAFIDNINVTTFAVTFDPNDYPVISWNNKFAEDPAQCLWISYPNARVGLGSGWQKHVVDGNDWSYTGTHNDISINSAGLTFIGYLQPYFRACGDPLCIGDSRDRLKAAMQWFETSLPIVMK